MHFLERYITFCAIAYDVSRSRREIEQRADCASRSTAGAQFKNLSEQDENGDDCSRFEIDADFPVGGERRREELRQ